MNCNRLEFSLSQKPSRLTETLNASQGDVFRICICSGGHAVIKINQQPYQVSPDVIFCIGPEDRFELISEEEKVNGRMISYTKSSLVDNTFHAGQFDELPMFRHSASPCIRANEGETRVLFQIADFMECRPGELRTAYESALIKNLLWAFLFETAMVYSRCQNTSPLRPSREMELNVKFQQLLIKNAQLQHNLKYYSDLLFISPKYLIHVVKKTTGKTPREIINEAIVEKAKGELRKIDHAIGMIADDLNFSDQASFSKFFKRLTGYTPMCYRNLNLEHIADHQPEGSSQYKIA